MLTLLRLLFLGSGNWYYLYEAPRMITQKGGKYLWLRQKSCSFSANMAKAEDPLNVAKMMSEEQQLSASFLKWQENLSHPSAKGTWLPLMIWSGYLITLSLNDGGGRWLRPTLSIKCEKITSDGMLIWGGYASGSPASICAALNKPVIYYLCSLVLFNRVLNSSAVMEKTIQYNKPKTKFTSWIERSAEEQWQIHMRALI